MKKDIWVADLMKKIQEKLVYEYIGHMHRARWLDHQFKMCKDTFSLGKIVFVVNFSKNYILKPQNEV